MKTKIAVLASVILVLAACGGSKGAGATLSFSASPLQSMTTNGGTFIVAIRSSPQPPQLGESNFEFTITDSSGNSADGLTIGVIPWMPQMGHGTSVTPSVKDVGGGVYQITDVYLFMSGEWQLRSTINGPMDGGSVSDTMDPIFQIP